MSIGTALKTLLKDTFLADDRAWPDTSDAAWVLITDVLVEYFVSIFTRVFTATLDGLVPHPGPPTGRFLRDDATWASSSTLFPVGAVQAADFVPVMNAVNVFDGTAVVGANLPLAGSVANGTLVRFYLYGLGGTSYLQPNGSDTVDGTSGLDIQTGYGVYPMIAVTLVSNGVDGWLTVSGIPYISTP